MGLMPSRSVFSTVFSSAVLALGLATAVAAQVPQLSQDEIQRLLSDPQASEAIRQRIAQSGMTPDQIRAQLQAAGYPPALLDQYFRTGGGALAAPGDSVVRAMALLGLGGPTDLRSFADSLRRAALDSLTRDSLIRTDSMTRLDSLRLADTLGLQLFGLDVFRRTTSQFVPNVAGPVDANYRLGPGDILVLILTGDVELAHQLEVTREGFVVIPQVGQVFVNNLTLEQLRDVLYTRLGRVYSGVRRGQNATTQFEVTVARVRMAQVYVLGEVTRPGSYQIPSVSTVLSALYEAGGPSERGNFRAIRVIRGQDTVATLDLYEYLLGGVATGDVRLETGDRVFVPAHGPRVKLAGAVVRPAIYEMRPGGTLGELVDAAGGFSADAALRRISISRIVPPAERRPGDPEHTVVDVPIEQVVEGRAPPFPLAAGDSVTVFAVAEGRRGVVELRGAVYHDGTYGWRAGLRLSDLIELAGGFRPAVYAGRAHIERLHPADSTRYILTAQLPADSTAPWTDDPALAEFDVVTVYGREEFREERTVRVSGMVNEPGVFPYREGMTLKDVVLMARGLRDGAWLDTAEIARLPESRDGGMLSTQIRVPMDSSYLFEPGNTTYPFLPGLPANAELAPDVPLAPYDLVSILRQPDFELLRTVVITGEVRFPGPYALTRKDERVSDLVRRAGGLLPTAYVDGGRFVRQVEQAGRVALSLPDALGSPGSRQDIILQPGDSLDVPEFNPVVRVIGAVTSPTAVLWQRGRSLEHYIANAGGYARDADKALVSVRYADGTARTKNKFLFFSSAPEPGPGSTVFVPEKPERGAVNVAPIFAALAQVLAAAATIVVVATR